MPGRYDRAGCNKSSNSAFWHAPIIGGVREFWGIEVNAERTQDRYSIKTNPIETALLQTTSPQVQVTSRGLSVMNDIKSTLWLAICVTACIWGCSRSPGLSTAQMDRLKVLEAKCAKLEEDQFAVSEARDAARQRLATAEMEIGDLKTQVTVLHEVRKERDLLSTRVDKMKKGLEELIGADTALADSLRPTTAREKTPRNKVQAIPAAGSAAKTFPQ